MESLPLSVICKISIANNYKFVERTKGGQCIQGIQNALVATDTAMLEWKQPFLVVFNEKCFRSPRKGTAVQGQKEESLSKALSLMPYND